MFKFLAALMLAGFVFLGSGPGASMAQIAPIPEPPAAVMLPSVLAARLTTTPERARLIVDLSRPAKFAIVSLASPNRIAVDVNAASLALKAPPPLAGKAGLVTSYSLAMAATGRVRATLVLAGPAKVQQAYVLKAFGDQPARLVVDFITDTPAHFAATVAADLAASNQPSPAMTPAGDTTGPAGSSEIRPLIVLDPGHGGIDSGAHGPNGLEEKNIVLAFALKLEKMLVATGRFDVAMTRTDDSYLTLDQRVQLARQNKADLFISIHADTFDQPQVHGTTVYTRDPKATDELDKVLADNENKSDLVAGYAAPKMPPAAVNVLVELMRRQTRRQSYIAAEAIVDALKSNVQLRPTPERQANFFVLQAPDVPSMLIELGFLSNPDDVAKLVNPRWQNKAAADITEGVVKYFDESDAE